MLNYKKQLESCDNPAQKNILETNISTFNNKQMALKILLNSLYGALSNIYFRYFDIRLAESITMTGQFIIRYSEKTGNDYLNKITGEEKDRTIACDTDSNYFCLSDVVKKFKPKNTLDFLDKFCSQGIEPQLAKAFELAAQKLNCRSNEMVMKREAISDKVIWTGAKHYILNVLDNEGIRYSEPKLKISGIEAIKSSTPSICRNALKDIFVTIMNKGEKETKTEILKFKNIFENSPPEEVSFPRGTNDIGKWINKNKNQKPYKSGTPIHVRGSILYNNMLKTLDLTNKYEMIRNGDKVKFTYLKMPNPLGENVIAFNDILPPEFGLHDYIDYDTQVEKTFIDIVESITDVIGWNISEKTDLSDFFV
jgi:DNA polymerase elongation subunit (family B)